MTPHERELILKVADELRTADRAAVEPEAERLIRAEVAAQPHAAYLLTQRVIVQDLALQQARSRIDELEGRLRQAGLLSGGPGGSAAGGVPHQTEPPASARSGVGDFLRTAAAAAAGTIGAQLIYDGLRHWAAGNGGGFGSAGFLGGSAGGGFGPGRADTGADTDDQDRGRGGDFDTDIDDQNRGGGGDFGTDPSEEDGAGDGGDWGDEDTDAADDDQDEVSGDGSGGDW